MATLTQTENQIRPLYIDGYTHQLSYVPGEEIAFHISTSAENYSLEIARIGARREVVWHQAELPGEAQPIPADASSQGCGWSPTFTLEVPETWQSGYYEGTLRATDGGGAQVYRNHRTAESTLFFIVRPAEPGANTSTLLQLSTNTYNAYNNWGGFSLYGYHGASKIQGNRVSFDRPMRGICSNWELPFIVWAEQNGYTFDYAANSDLEFHPEMLEHYKLVLSVGHDEYWSAPMRDNLEAFIANGGNAAFFSGNSVCWQVRSEDDGRALVCWKQTYNQDPVYKTDDHSTLSTLWSHYLVDRPENQLTGVGFLQGGYHLSHGQFMDGAGEYTAHRPEHWVFEGTHLSRDDTFGGENTIVGYECDGCEWTLEDGLPVPTYQDGTPEGFTILATAPVRWHPDDCEWYERWERGRTGAATMGIYTKGGTVFTAATTDWSHGLAGGDAAVERITHNVLRRLSV